MRDLTTPAPNAPSREALADVWRRLNLAHDDNPKDKALKAAMEKLNAVINDPIITPLLLAPIALDKYGAPVRADRSEDPTWGTQEVKMTDPDTGADTDALLAITAPADVNVARWVLEQSVNQSDGPQGEGRSPLLWVRLQNGDLLLGCYPQAEVYEATETDPRRP